MGDIGTHADITKFMIGQAQRVVPETQIPEADYAFVELGNFLTDVSQFRDPPAFHRAREQARTTAGFGGKIFGSDGWVREVFGRREGPLHGALPEMMRLFMEGAAHLVFDDDGLSRIGGLVAEVTDAGPSVLLAHGIPPAQVDAALKSNFTQYFPHEHLDALPLRSGELARHRQRDEFTVGQRGLLRYLEWYLQYLSEGLAGLEARWLKARSRPGGILPAERQQMLLQLGHLLHALEDYFFHSNLPELYAWEGAKAARRGMAGAQHADRAELVRSALAQTRVPSTSVPMRRVLSRRLRYPAYEANDTLSTSASDDADSFVYTGGFGQTDVWHTLGGALEALEEQVDKLPRRFDPRTTDLVLFRLMLDRSARAEMVKKNSLEDQRKLHLKQLLAGDYHHKVRELGSGHKLCPHAEASLLAAFDLDERVSRKHDRIVTFPGPGAVLVTMLDTMEREREASAAAKDRLDETPGSIEDLVSNNGCSGENIGTHTLMSKDATSKEPLRPEAVALAKHASASIGLRFLRRVTQPGPVDQHLDTGVNWDAELQHVIRGVVQNGWESELLSALRSSDSFRQPDVASLRDQPEIPLLGPASEPAKLVGLRAGGAVQNMESYYRSMES